MKKVVLALVSALAGAVLASALPASAHHTYSVQRLANRIDALENLLYDCTFVQGMTAYGIPEDGEGYIYDLYGAEELTTAIDFDDSLNPHIWTLATDESCIDFSRRDANGFSRNLEANFKQVTKK